SRGPRIRRHDRPGRDATKQRVSVRLLHARRLPRTACDRRTDLVDADDGPRRNQRLCRQCRAPPAVFCAVLALSRHHLGLAVLRRLSDGSPLMTETLYDRAPGDSSPVFELEPSDVVIYTIGLVMAVVLTAVSFWVANTSLLWGPGISLGLAVLAIAQMGIHLVFVLHITTAPHTTNNVLAHAFGVLIIVLV